MELSSWVGGNWFALLQSVGIIGGLWYTARSFRFDAKVRQVGNLIEFTAHHHRIWSQLYENPELSRVREKSPNLSRTPITLEEELFVTQVILHVASVYRASKEGVISELNGTEADIRQFFSNEIPRDVWLRKKAFQEADFVEFVESLLTL